VDATDEQGNLTRDKRESVNKIGHGNALYPCGFGDTGSCASPALHELDPLFRRVTLENERLKQLVRDLRFHRDPLGE
jgi:phytanoyl-CoA hydroxylase